MLEAQQLDLWRLWEHTRRKCSLAEDSIYWLARGLAYFEDAEREPEPKMRRPLAWTEVLAFFQSESRTLLDRLRQP